MDKIHYRSENVVRIVVRGVIVDTIPRSDADAALGDREQDVPDWLQPFTAGVVEGKSGSSGSAGETIPKTPPPHISAKLTQKQDSPIQPANPQRYLIGKVLSAASGWRGDHTRQLKPQTSQTT